VAVALGVFFPVATAFGADAPVLAADPESTGAQRIALIGPSSAAELAETVAGRGIPGTDPVELNDDRGGNVVWRLERTKSDELGMTHSFYRQYYVPRSPIKELLQPPYDTEGVPILGSSIGLHVAGTELRSVFGAQYSAITLDRAPVVGAALLAHSTTVFALMSLDQFEPLDPAELTAQEIAVQRQGTKLYLVSAGDGRTLRPVWRVPVFDANRVPHVAHLDAADASILRVARTVMADGPCDAATSPVVTATAVRQLSGPDRSVWATPDPNAGFPLRQGFPYEAHRGAMLDGIPEIQVYQYFDSSFVEQHPFYGMNSAWGTLNCGDTLAGVLPLSVSAGSPRYDNYEVPVPYEFYTSSTPVHGRAAGDAMWNTYLTMYTFKNDLQRTGWDGQGGAATVVVNDYWPDLCQNARFVAEGSSSQYPTPAVSFHVRCNDQDLFEPMVSSSLDTVAHEWGHGVVFDEAFPYDIPMHQQLHEGFADFIGHMVERYREGMAADWLFQEDYIWPEGWKRRVDSTEQACGAFHRTDACNCRCGNPYNADEPHFRGNQLGVVYYMIYEGVKNPACERLQNCLTMVPARLGKAKSSRTLFRTLTYYVADTTSWWTLPDLAKAAAFDVSANCAARYCAFTEQQSVETAFLAIGYSGITGYHRCSRGCL
jgi:hypothetical protein